jgi:CubicO group peptidase (beta-lactamase class C family)
MLLAEVITRACGRPIDVIARDMLFSPLGITDVEWVRYADGTPVASSGLRMRAADLVKIGQLVLNRGTWDDRRIVPASWIAESTAPHIGADGLYFYGFQWWLGRSLVKRESVAWIAAIGYGGQRMYVVPSLGLVVVVLAGLYARPDLSPIVGETILNEYVLAGLIDGASRTTITIG